MTKANRRFRPALERLEDRLTPTNVSATLYGTILTITKVSGNDSLTVAQTATFGQLTVSTTAGNTVNNSPNPFTTRAGVGITRVVVNLGTGTDSLTFDGASIAAINLIGGLSVSGTGGDKTLALTDVNLLHGANLNVNLTGNGSELSTFTDVNVGGAATISHPGAGNTEVTITSGPPNLNTVFNWGSLSITNGQGSDVNTVDDTNFAGNVTINDGPGEPGNTGTQGGSQTTFADRFDRNLATIGGNLSVATASGQSDTEIYDYNVQGNVTVNAGAGVAGQTLASIVGVDFTQTFGFTGIPTIGGNVNIIGSTVPTPSPGLLIDLGTSNPLIIHGNLSVNVTGNGSVDATISDLRMASGSANITLGGQTHDNTVTIQGSGTTSSFQSMTIASHAGSNNFNIQTAAGQTDFGGSLSFQLGSGTDTIQLGHANSSPPPNEDGTVHIAGDLNISGTGGDKTISVLGTDLTGSGNLNMHLEANGAENSTFTDVSLAGAATVKHPGAGNTNFTITTSGGPNVNTVFKWGSLSIANGQGADVNLISDTDFAGNVTINNGPGAANNVNWHGGSYTNISATNDENLATIGGNVTITTASGESDSELYDYKVSGNVSINTGAGIAGQNTGSFVGIENTQSFSTSGIPVIGGNVTITGTAVFAGPLLVIDLGTASPLTIDGNLSVNANGAGSAAIDLNDLSVANGSTSLTLGGQTHDNTVSVQGSTVTSVFDSFTMTSAASETNTYNIQDQAGTLEFAGPLNLQLGVGSDTVNLAADINHIGGFPGAVVDLFGTSTFNGGPGTNDLFEGTHNAELFFTSDPQISHFTVH